MATDLPTVLRVLDFDDPSTVLLTLEAPAAGLTVLGPLEVPRWSKRQRRRKGAGFTGSVGYGRKIPDDGVLGFTLRVLGSSWAETCTRYHDVEVAVDGLDVLDRYLVEVELSGVRTRYVSDAAVVMEELPITGASRKQNRKTADMRFLVQPGPSFTITGG